MMADEETNHDVADFAGESLAGESMANAEVVDNSPLVMPPPLAAPPPIDVPMPSLEFNISLDTAGLEDIPDLGAFSLDEEDIPGTSFIPAVDEDALLLGSIVESFEDIEHLETLEDLEGLENFGLGVGKPGILTSADLIEPEEGTTDDMLPNTMTQPGHVPPPPAADGIEEQGAGDIPVALFNPLDKMFDDSDDGGMPPV